MIPGRMLHRLAAVVCSAKSLTHVVEPAIADLQREQRLVAFIASYFAVLRVIGLCALDVSLTTNDDRRAVMRTLLWAFGLTIALTMLLILPPLSIHPELKEWGGPALLVPQALPLAIPVGLAFAIAFGLSKRVSMSLVKGVLAGAAVASLISFVTFAWLIPAANQTFRELTVAALQARGYESPVNLQKGLSEMTLSELRTEISAAASQGELRRARTFSRAFHFRFSLGTAALALAACLLAVPIDRRILRGLLACAACFVYWALIFVGEFAARLGYLWPIAGAWLPNVVLAAVAMLFLSLRSSRLPEAVR